MSKINRPLVQRELSGSGWHLGVITTPLPSPGDIDIPQFLWMFNAGDGVQGRELLAMPDSGLLILKEKKGANPRHFTSVDSVLNALDEYGWGEPPQLDRVFQDAQDAARKLKILGGTSAIGAISLLKELSRRWSWLIKHPG